VWRVNGSGVVVVCGVSIDVAVALVNSKQAESTERKARGSENALARTAAWPNSSAAITSAVLPCVQRARAADTNEVDTFPRVARVCDT
jgi:hypothetical protein